MSGALVPTAGPSSSAEKANVASALAERADGADVIVVPGGVVSPVSGLKAVQSNWMLIEEPW